MSTISDFKNNFRGGVRPNLYKVVVNAPAIFGAMDLQFLGKATQIPGSVIGNIDVAYRGRMLKVPGDRTFEDWTVTIINDEDFAVRAGLEEWVQSINSTQGNLRLTGANPEAYKSQGSVIHFGKQGDVIREYKFVGLFPTSIGSIELSWDTVDSIEEYQVTWSYDFFTVDVATTFGGLIN